MRFLIGSSFFSGKMDPDVHWERALLWAQNTAKADVKPTRAVVILEGGTKFPGANVTSASWGIDFIRLTGDLGHIHDHLDGGPKSHHAFTGWSASMLALAMTAYVDEADFIYKESDCFAFGPWVQRMYGDCGAHGWVFGPKMTSAPWMACQQSLFLVKHAMIPSFVRMFLEHGPENDRGGIGETRFVNMEKEIGQAARLSFGVDRMRPIPWDDEVFYFQQPTPDELAEAKRRHLL